MGEGLLAYSPWQGIWGGVGVFGGVGRGYKNKYACFLNFQREDWVLGNVSTQIWHFSKVLSGLATRELTRVRSLLY